MEEEHRVQEAKKEAIVKAEQDMQRLLLAQSRLLDDIIEAQRVLESPVVLTGTDEKEDLNHYEEEPLSQHVGDVAMDGVDGDAGRSSLTELDIDPTEHTPDTSEDEEESEQESESLCIYLCDYDYGWNDV